jgi:ketosteroid isomerase-like protein
MKKFSCCLFVLFVLCGVAIAQKNLKKEEAQLFQTEIDFAKLSETKGAAAAFAAYFAEDSVLLPHNGNPVTGRDAIVKYLGEGYTLLWKPLRAEVSNRVIWATPTERRKQDGRTKTANRKSVTANI